MITLENRLTMLCKVDLGSLCATPSVSPDSRKIAYPIKSKKWFSEGMKVCVNGIAQRHYESVSGLVFSPNSQHFAYVAVRKNRLVVICDGEEISNEYDDISLSTPIFSPDSQHIAFGARLGNKWFAVKDGAEEESHYGFVSGSMTFSSDSKLGYSYYKGQLSGRLQLGGKIIVIDNGKKVAEYDVATNNNRNTLIVVNDNELDMDINLAVGANFMFDTCNSFYTMVISKNKFYQLNVMIK